MNVNLTHNTNCTNVNLQPNITGAKVNISKGATQSDLFNAVNNAKLYRDESESFSIVSENKSIESTNSALNASISATTAGDKATIATTKAAEASNSASSASASETVCIAKATIATDKADIATAQAVISTDKASEASTSASTATTQAGIATTKASEASASASNALTSANNADTSEANALTYRNQAEAFANSINTSDIVHISGTETITGDKTFSGTVSGITKTMVGLGNVTNESKETMFTSPTFTGTVSGITKSMIGLSNVDNTADSAKNVLYATTAGTASASDVYAWAKASVKPTYTASEVGLGNVDNTSDANKPVSTATQTALNLKANLASPTFTGTPIAPTASVGTNSTQVATTAFVNAEIANNTYAVPTGTIISVAVNSTPTGYLKCNGAVISRTTYSALFSIIGTTFGNGDGSTTFNLPDLRGYFPRGWDDGRGIDTGRVFGTTQSDAYLNHSHTGTAASAGEHTHTTGGTKISGGTLSYNGSAGGSEKFGSTTSSSSGAHTHTVTVDASTSGSTETRPKNIALLYCIKY